MVAGLFYTTVGPFVAAAIALGFVYLAFRSPMGGVVGFLGLVHVSPYFTYRDDLQAIALGLGVVVLAIAAGIRRPHPAGVSARTPDVLFATFAVLAALALWRGYAAGHARGLLAADAYHYLLAGALLYFAVRRLVHPREVPRVLGAYVAIAAFSAAAHVLLIWRAASGSELLWLVGAPLDTGGVRLKPDFAFPLVPLVVALALVLDRPTARRILAAGLLAGALALTYKRTFWAGSLAGLCAVLALGASVRPVLGGRRRAAALLVVLLVGMAVALAAGLDATDAARRGRELSRPESVGTVGTRLEELDAVASYVREHPILGLGLGAAPAIPRPDGAPRHYTHNLYLHWCLLAGLPAGLSMLALVSVVLVRSMRARGDPSSRALGGALFGLALSGLALQSFNTPIAALMLALAVTRTGRSAGGKINGPRPPSG